MLRQLKRRRQRVRRHAAAFTIEQEQRAVAGGLEIAVVSGVFLLGMNRELGAGHVQHHRLRRADGFRLREQFSVGRNPTGKVSFLRDQSCLERLWSRGQGAPRTRIFSEPTTWNFGPCETRSASLTCS